MRILIVAILLLVSPIFSSAEKPLILRGFGLTLGQTNLPNYLMYNNQFGWNTLERVNTKATLLAFNYILHSNLYSWNSDNSIALDLRPTLGVYIGKEKAENFYVGDGPNFPLLLRMPIILEWNYGVLSTVETDKNFGIGFGVGVNYQFTYDGDYHSYDEDYYSSPNYSVYGGRHELWQPAINLSFRRWTKANICVEYNLNYGFAQETFMNQQFNRNTLTLSLSGYFNY